MRFLVYLFVIGWFVIARAQVAAAEGAVPRAAAPAPQSPYPLAPPAAAPAATPVEKSPVGEKAAPAPQKPAVTIDTSDSGWVTPSRGIIKPEDVHANFTVGTNLYWPQAHLEVAIVKRVSLGLMPGYFQYKFQGITSKHTGGYLTVNSYSQRNFEGIWVRFGLGAFQTKSSSAALNGTQPTVSALLTVGRRWRWDSFNLALAAGGMYFEQVRTQQFPLRLGVFYPGVTFDLGFAW